MSWVKAKPVACVKCGVLFMARAKSTPFPDLCEPHRAEAVALQDRKDAVAKWAALHWEALEPLSKVAHTQMLSISGQGGGFASGGGGYGSLQQAMSNTWASQL